MISQLHHGEAAQARTIAISVRVAAYQASLAACQGREVIERIREQVHRCESLGVEILCCPEGSLGGLADYAYDPYSIAIAVGRGDLASALAPLASGSVTTIVGFTEIDENADLYNAAAVFHRGAVTGVYRKMHPAIHHSRYRAGTETPVFTVGELTFGILICLDSTFPEPARTMVAQGARALFIPTNTGMPRSRGGPELVAEARGLDTAIASQCGVAVVRSDVTGVCGDLISHGSSAIVGIGGEVLAAAAPMSEALIVADVVV